MLKKGSSFTMPEANLTSGSLLAVVTSVAGISIFQNAQGNSLLLIFGVFSVIIGLVVVASHAISRLARKFIR